MLTPVCLEVSLIPTLFLEFNTSCLCSGKQSVSSECRWIDTISQLARWTLTNFNPELNLLSGSLWPAAGFDHFEPIEPPAWFDGIDCIDGELT